MKKKEYKPLVKKVILHPGPVRSKYDGDKHFISSSQLMNLYGVLPTDIVITYDPKRNYIPEDRKQVERWIDLYPSYQGDYRDIHELDRYQPIMR